MPQLPIGSGWHNRRARLITGTFALCQAAAGEAERYMKANAPWTDRTSLARQGLTGEAFSDPSGGTDWRMGVALGHTMEYGKWLETVSGPAMGQRASLPSDTLADPANAGPLAIIHPGADHTGPRLVGAVKSLWGKP